MVNKFDSEAFYERMYVFGLDCHNLIRFLAKTDYNIIYSTQLIRSSASTGANYIEALEALSKKDFIHRLKISRKEMRESMHWLRFIKDTNNTVSEVVKEALKLIDEAQQIKRMLTSSILTIEKGTENRNL